MKKILLGVVGMLVLSAPAFAVTDQWAQCGGNTPVFGAPTQPSVGRGECWEYQWTTGTTALIFTVTTEYARIYFDADNASGSVPGTPAEIMVQLCAFGSTPSDNTCGDVLDATLTGLEGAASTQRMSVRVARGLYRIVRSVAPTSVTAVIQLQGE